MNRKPVIIGIPKEIMSCEGRVPVVPEFLVKLRESCERKVIFLAEGGLGEKVGYKDADWMKYAAVVKDKKMLFKMSDIILKVKQPLDEEVQYFREGQGLSCFCHVAATSDTMNKLLVKKVKIMPWEFHRPVLSAMSREAGSRVPEIIDACFMKHSLPLYWEKENFLVIGARGIAGQHAISALINRGGVKTSHIAACALENGVFVSPETKFTYETFSSRDDHELRAHLKECRVLVLAAVKPVGGAPKVLSDEHLRLLPDNSFIIQIAIDEGGNIENKNFCKVTYWDNPVYEVEFEGKRHHIFNVPDIPGVIRPEDSVKSLSEVMLEYLPKIIQTWPDVPPDLVFRGSGA